MLKTAGIFAAGATLAAAEINPMKHDIQAVTSVNFEKVLSTALPLTVSAVWYHGDLKSSGEDKAFLDTWNQLAGNFKKQLKILSVDCSQGGNKKLCERVGVKSTPHIQIYPQSPQPHFQYTGAKTNEELQKILRRLMGSKVNPITTPEEFTSFKSKNPTKQKILLFSDKRKAPPMLKALSTDTVFARTVEFSFVGEVGTNVQSDAIVELAGKPAKKTPVLMMISKGKTMW